MQEIKLKINLTDLEKDCKRISRIFFKNEKKNCLDIWSNWTGWILPS